MYLGPGLESVLVRVSDTGIYWYLSLAREFVPSDTRAPAAILAQMSPRMDATFRAVTSNTEELRCDELVDRDPLPRWGEGVVTLLGDAASVRSAYIRFSLAFSTSSQGASSAPNNRCSGIPSAIHLESRTAMGNSDV